MLLSLQLEFPEEENRKEYAVCLYEAACIIYMEKCCYSLQNDFAGVNLEEYPRIYIGDEFCDNSLIYHIPKTEELMRKYVGQKNISIMFPVMNEWTFNKIEAWLEKIRKQYDNEFEIICNDIGSYTYFNNMKYHVVVGRLLTRVIMHYLARKDAEGVFKENVQRVELDATNIKRAHSLREYKRSFYNMYSVYGHANNRCVYRENGVFCKNVCRNKNIILNNTYLNDTYQIVKNVIIHKENSMNVSILFDRLVDIFE